DFHVTGVQTCALPIFAASAARIASMRPLTCSSGGTCAGSNEATRNTASVSDDTSITPEFDFSFKSAVLNRVLRTRGSSKMAASRSEERRVGKDQEHTL